MAVSECYAPLPEIDATTLRILARNREVMLSEEEAKQALNSMLSLPPHPDVKPALEQLKQSGFRLWSLTNSSSSGVKAQLENAGIASFFEKQLSVEMLGKYKPHRAI